MKFLGSVTRLVVWIMAVMVISSPHMVVAPETSLEQQLPVSPATQYIQPAIQAPNLLTQTGGTLVAYAKQDIIKVFNQPEGEVTQTLHREGITYDPSNPLFFVVVETQTDWLEVMLPVRPNESTGWVRRTDVNLGRANLKMVVDLSDRQLCVSVVNVDVCYPVAIGTAENPTPVGNFFIEAWLNVTEDPIFGPYQFVLSGYSETETTFLGGNGVIGIHGTNEPQLIGTAASHGCIRMNNQDITTLIKLGVTPGTPVLVQE